MLSLLRKIYHIALEYKRRHYLKTLVRHGLKLGSNVVMMDGVFLDPTHCYLISIGDNNVLAPNVRLIVHDASIKQFLGYTRLGKVTIEENCFLGDSAIVLPGVTIGANSIIGGGSVVTKDVPPGSLAAGNPCRVICPCSVYIQRHKEKLQTGRVPYDKIDQERLTVKQQQEIMAFLSDDAGYVR